MLSLINCILVYLKDSNAASHFVNSLILFAFSRTTFVQTPQKNVSKCWYPPALLCVYANRKMAVVLTNFSAMFSFETCVKESENQPNGFVESRKKVPTKSVSEGQGLNKRF